MVGKRLRPIVKKGKQPTLTGNPPLGYLISCHCPKCDRHLFSYYEGDVLPREDGKVHFRLAEDWNYCSRCGQHLDLDQWKSPDPSNDDLKLVD